MRIFGAVVAVFVLVGSGVAQSAAPARLKPPATHRLTAAEAAEVLQGDCTEVKRTAAFPEALKLAFRNAMREREFSLADPGEEYQSSDVILKPGLPGRRLVFASNCAKYWLVYYERGGFAHYYAATMFEQVSARVMRQVWGGAGGEKARNRDALRAEIASKEMKAGVGTQF